MWRLFIWGRDRLLNHKSQEKREEIGGNVKLNIYFTTLVLNFLEPLSNCKSTSSLCGQELFILLQDTILFVVFMSNYYSRILFLAWLCHAEKRRAHLIKIRECPDNYSLPRNTFDPPLFFQVSQSAHYMSFGGDLVPLLNLRNLYGFWSTPTRLASPGHHKPQPQPQPPRLCLCVCHKNTELPIAAPHPQRPRICHLHGSHGFI